MKNGAGIKRLHYPSRKYPYTECTVLRFQRPGFSAQGECEAV